jgi:Ran GTPase-activating protein (RanGAP) involved in mRNA processing and transport
MDLEAKLKLNRIDELRVCFAEIEEIGGIHRFTLLMKTNTSVVQLHLSFCRLEFHAKCISSILAENPFISEINLCGNNLRDAGVKCIAQDLNNLKVIDLGMNGIGDDGMMWISEALTRNSSLCKLVLLGNQIGDRGAWSLGEALKVNKCLEEIVLERNSIGDEGARWIGDALIGNRHLRVINLKLNNIGWEGARWISKSLELNSSLTCVNLNDNHIGIEGAKCFGQALLFNKAMREFYIGGNQIRHEGAEWICKALMELSLLEVVDLSNNSIKYEGAQFISKALESNNSLKAINLSRNEFEAESARLISASLYKSSLQKLDLKLNSIGVEGVIWIAKMLEVNSYLEILNLDVNNINDSPGIHALVVALNINTCLQTIHLTGNYVCEESLEIISKHIERNRHTRMLNLFLHLCAFLDEKRRMYPLSFDNHIVRRFISPLLLI